MPTNQYGTDPFGILARGDPSAGSSGSGVSVGRVGTPVRDYSNPGRAVGTGIGVKVNMPLSGSGGTYKPDIKGVKPTEKMAKGGAAKSGCSVKAFGDMIKKQAGGPVSMPDYRTSPTTTGVKMKKGGKVQTSSDTARKLATEMGGMKKGGKPVKKAAGGSLGSNGKPLSAGQMQRVAQGPTAAQQATLKAFEAGRPRMSADVNYKGPEGAAARQAFSAKRDAYDKANNPAFHMRGTKLVNRPMFNTQAPSAQELARTAEKSARRASAGGTTGEGAVKLAKGGAGKVRKGMMSPSGKILQVVKPKKGGM